MNECKPDTKELYIVPVTWQAKGLVYVEASSAEEAIETIIRTERIPRNQEVVRGSVQVINPEEVITDREYRSKDGAGPKYHLIGSDIPERIHIYLKQIEASASAQGVKITSNIPGFGNTLNEEFNDSRLKILLSEEVHIDLFNGEDEIVVDNKELDIYEQHGVAYTQYFTEILMALIRQGDILILSIQSNKMHLHENSIIMKLLWRYIHTFKAVYIETDNYMYTDYGDEVCMTCHWLSSNGEDEILDTESFEDRLIKQDIEKAEQPENKEGH